MIIKKDWVIKPSYLLFIIVLTYIIWGYISFNTIINVDSILLEISFDYLWYLILVLFLFFISQKAEVNFRALIGSIKIEFIVLKYLSTSLALISLSLGGLYIVWYPISHLFPEVAKIITDNTPLLYSSGENYELTNLFKILDLVIFAPVIEEFFFRGFLFTSFTNKWSIKKSILFSSLLFGIFHADIVGSVVFGIVLCIYYLNIRSILAPILIHSLYNILILIFSYLYNLIKYDNNAYSITAFQNEWWLGLLGLVIGIPWLILFFKKNDIKDKIIPYHVNQM